MKIMVWNGATDNANLGCQALGLSLIAGVLKKYPSADVWNSVSGSEVHEKTIQLEGKPSMKFKEFGASMSWNPFKAGNYWRDKHLLRVLGPLARSRFINLIRSSDMIIDISGGDSFTSMYGEVRYQWMILAKKMALEIGTPLVLAPETYGPFSEESKDDAASVIRRSAMAWGRDRKAADFLKSLGLEPRWCPDVAFGLPVRELTNVVRDRPAIGLNVSGLIWKLAPELLAKQYGIHLDYKAYMEEISRYLLEKYPEHDLLLISHVQSARSSHESDLFACEELKKRLPEERVRVAPKFVDSMDAKATISKCDLMLGTRMHACIAALSKGIPTIGFAYSLKAGPVFDTLGVASMVVDLRSVKHDQAMNSFLDALDQVEDARVSLVGESAKARNSVSKFFSSLDEVVN